MNGLEDIFGGEDIMSLRNNAYRIGFYLSVVAIAGVLIYGITHRTNGPEKEMVKPLQEDSYHLNGRTVAEFQPVILEKFNEESKLEVLSVDAAEPVNVTAQGFMGIGDKSQNLTYRGIGEFYLDLSSLDARNITLDDEKQSITISIPRTKLEPIEIDPDKFEAGETEKGFLAFGEMKFTAKEYNKLEKEAKQKVFDAVNKPENFTRADERAIEEMKKIYDPVVKTVDASYSVNIEFVGFQGKKS